MPKPSQVELAKKAAALKKKQPIPPGLGHHHVLPVDDMPASNEKFTAAHQSQGPPRLLDKHEVGAITGASFPTIWNWMRAGTFPLARVVGGKSKWFSTDVEAWMAQLPIRKLKGHDDGEAA